MYQFVLTYRIGQKEIIDHQIFLANVITSYLKETAGDKTLFAERVRDLKRWSNSLSNYFDQDLIKDQRF